MRTEPTERKYLLLMQPEEKYPVLFNSYMFLIMEVIALAKKLDRVFVLPYIHSQPRNWTLCERGETDNDKLVLGTRIDPMEDFFDKEVLARYVSVISFKEFMALSGGELTDLALFGVEHQNPTRSYGYELSFKHAHRIKTMIDLESIKGVFLGITGYPRGTFLVKNSPNWHDDPTQEYWEIRRHLVYRKELTELAERFIEANLSKNYVAVHWRRGDRLLPEMQGQFDELIRDDEDMKKAMRTYLIRPVQKVMERTGIRSVFLATTSGTPWHIDYIKGFLPIVQYPEAVRWEDKQIHSIVEQLICMRSAYYLSSPHRYTYCSAFSRWIIDEKMLRGNAKSISYLKKIRHTRSITETLIEALRQTKRYATTMLRRVQRSLY